MINKFKIANDYISQKLEDYTHEYFVPEIDGTENEYPKDHMFDKFIDWYCEYFEIDDKEEVLDDEDIYSIYCSDYEPYEEFCKECKLNDKDEDLFDYWLTLTNDIFDKWND